LGEFLFRFPLDVFDAIDVVPAMIFVSSSQFVIPRAEWPCEYMSDGKIVRVRWKLYVM
jgi:hypothetical protein